MNSITLTELEAFVKRMLLLRDNVDLKVEKWASNEVAKACEQLCIQLKTCFANEKFIKEIEDAEQ